jgi:hypothetical protein
MTNLPVTISGLARELKVPPRCISDLIYAGVIDAGRMLQLGNRRVFPHDYVGEVREIIKSRTRRAEMATA